MKSFYLGKRAWGDIKIKTIHFISIKLFFNTNRNMEKKFIHFIDNFKLSLTFNIYLYMN